MENLKYGKSKVDENPWKNYTMNFGFYDHLFDN